MRSTVWGVFGAGCLAVAAALASCGTPPAETCGSDACTEGQRCVGGICRFTCGGTVTCPGGLACQGDLCLPGGGATSSSGGGGATSSSGFVVVVSSRGSSSARGATSSTEIGPSSSSTTGGTTTSTSAAPGSSNASNTSAGSTSLPAGSTSSTSVATSVPDVSSSGGGSSAASATSLGLSSSAASSSGGSSSSLDCPALANPCFTGAPDGAGGCAFTYKCPQNSVCTAPNNACEVMPGDGVTLFRGSGTCVRVPVPATQRTFMFCAPGVDRGWFDSYLDCMDLAPGFNLGSVTTLAEHDIIRGVLAGGRFWLGLADRGDYPQPCSGCPTPLGEGNFFWMDGTTFNATTFGGTLGVYPWCSGEPNDNGTEDCVEFRGDLGGCWNDHNCGDASPVDGVICSR